MIGIGKLARLDVFPRSPAIWYISAAVPADPRILSATPPRIRSPFRCRWKKASSSDIPTPANSAAAKPTHTLGVVALTITPVKAADSIVPSSPMLITPALSLMSAPSEGSRMGVVTRRIAPRKAALNTVLRMLAIMGYSLPVHFRQRCAHFQSDARLWFIAVAAPNNLQKVYKRVGGYQQNNHRFDHAHNIGANLGLALHHVRARAQVGIQQRHRGNCQRLVAGQ